MRRGASKQLESKEAGGVDPSQPHVYFFVWGLFMSLTIMATTVVSALVPWSLAKRVAHLAVLPPPLSKVPLILCLPDKINSHFHNSSKSNRCCIGGAKAQRR